MICQYCNKEARWVENKEIYGKNYGKSYMVWLCDCGAYVGCHKNSKKPLGTLANRELRHNRKVAHLNFDKLWKEYATKKKSRQEYRAVMQRRSEAYNKMNKYFGKEVHIGKSDIEMCKQIIEWAKAQRVS